MRLALFDCQILIIWMHVLDIHTVYSAAYQTDYDFWILGRGGPMNHAYPPSIHLFPPKLWIRGFPDEVLFGLKWTKRAQNEPKIKFSWVSGEFLSAESNFKWKTLQLSFSQCKSYICDNLVSQVLGQNALIHSYFGILCLSIPPEVMHGYPWYVWFRYLALVS